MALPASVTNEGHITTTAQERKAYDLSPTDYLEGGVHWFSWSIFFTSKIEWTRLVDALRHVEKSYPVLCGRLADYETNRMCIDVDPDGENGFSVLEIRADITLDEMRKGTGRMLTADAGKIPYINWPFFLDPISDRAALRDKESLFGVHLIHTQDGCLLNAATSHVLCDGTRYVQLLIDISRAYRGLEIGEKHMDRSFYWPDSYLQHFSLPSQTADMYPRRMIGWASLFDARNLCVAYIHLPETTIRRMKEETIMKLTGCDFLSTFDLVAALCWMLKAETRAAGHLVEAKDLPIKGTTCAFPMDARKASFPTIPESFFGNALLAAIVTFDNNAEYMNRLMDTLARAASLIRATIECIRTNPSRSFESALVYYRLAVGDVENLAPNLICDLASHHKMRFSDIDFGNGAPCYAHTMPSFPSHRLLCSIGPDPSGDGVLMYFVASTGHKGILETSTVIAECAPGAVVFFADD